MRRDDPRRHERVELVVRIPTGLVLDERGGVPHLPDVVVVGPHSGNERIRTDHLRGALGEVPDEQRVMVGAGGPQQELTQQRMVRVAQLAKLEHRGNTEDMPEDRHAGEGEEARAETAHQGAAQ